MGSWPRPDHRTPIASAVSHAIGWVLLRFRTGLKLRATFFYSGSSLICQAIRFAGLLISTGAIDAAGFGRFAIALMALGFCSTVRELGQNSALLSIADLPPGYARAHVFLTALTTLGAGICLVLAFRLIPAFADVRPLLPLLLIQLVLDGVVATPAIVAQKRFAFAGLAAIEIGSVTFWLVTLSIGLRFSRSAETLLLARIVESMLRGSLLAAWQSSRLLSGRVTTEIRRHYLRFAKLLTPKAWLESLGANLDVALLQAFTSNFEVGVYDRTNQLLRVPLSLSVNLVDAVAAASYSREQNDPTALKRSLWFFSIVIAIGAAAGVVLVGIFIWLLAGRLIGASWQQNLAAFWPWAVPVALVRPFFWNLNILFQSTGQPQKLLFNLLTGTVTLTATGLLLVPRWGLVGLFVALTISNLLPLLIQFSRLRQRRAA